jgi:hypothetical protein
VRTRTLVVLTLKPRTRGIEPIDPATRFVAQRARVRIQRSGDWQRFERSVASVTGLGADVCLVKEAPLQPRRRKPSFDGAIDPLLPLRCALPMAATPRER